MSFHETYLEWPHEVSLETFAKCNAACVFCPYTTLERIGTKMADEVIDRLIEELKGHPHPFMFSPFKVNEPFLDKRLVSICQKVNRELPNAHLRIFSNGSALTPQHIEGVAGLERVVHLWISLNDHRPDEYRRLMNLDFDRTAKNLDYLHDQILYADFPHQVMVSRVREKVEIGPEDIAFRRYVNERWPEFGVHLIKPDSWLGDIDRGSDEIPDKGCGRWYELSICADGKVSLCCMDSAASFAIGDIHKNTLYEIYNSKFWRERREQQLSRKKVWPCSTCSY